MKRNIILAVIAIFLLVVFLSGAFPTIKTITQEILEVVSSFIGGTQGIYILLALLLLVYLCSLLFKKKRVIEVADYVASCQSLDDVILKYGQPDDTVVLDASRANELQSLILFYHAADVAVIAGKEINISEITGVSPKNFASPYTVDEWGVVINTRNKNYKDIRLRVGYDGGMASDIANQIYKNIV